MGVIGLHREGRGWFYASLGIGLLVALLLATLRAPAWVWVGTSLLWLGWMGFLLLFFRTPHRLCPNQTQHIYAPCDGKVVEVKRTFEPKYFHAEMLQISIFMAPWDVHINWAPAAGKVCFHHHSPGTYLVAWHPKASLLNEQSFLAVRDSAERYYAVRQIAGVFARRIATYPTEGTRLQAGEEIGFIRFGSRIDLLLPLSARILVVPGQKVRGCITVVAEW
ncbi:MAG: phosphatidylserine decarboxylase [Bacteroidia bacterium]